jgi:hypothetical protein
MTKADNPAGADEGRQIFLYKVIMATPLKMSGIGEQVHYTGNGFHADR